MASLLSPLLYGGALYALDMVSASTIYPILKGFDKDWPLGTDTLVMGVDALALALVGSMVPEVGQYLPSFVSSSPAWMQVVLVLASSYAVLMVSPGMNHPLLVGSTAAFVAPFLLGYL